MKIGIIETRPVDAGQWSEIADIYMKAFRKHNIFQKSKPFVVKYLKQSQKKAKLDNGGYFVAQYYDPKDDTRDVAGAAFLSPEDEDLKKKHVRVKIKHLVVGSKYKNKGIGTELMNTMLDSIKLAIRNKKIKSAKVEIHVAADEKAAVPFYKKFGFKVEGVVSHHYRYGENMKILGRLVK